MYNLESLINQAVFPGLQGGPHNHAIAGTIQPFSSKLFQLSFNSAFFFLPFFAVYSDVVFDWQVLL